MLANLGRNVSTRENIWPTWWGGKTRYSTVGSAPMVGWLVWLCLRPHPHRKTRRLTSETRKRNTYFPQDTRGWEAGALDQRSGRSEGSPGSSALRWGRFRSAAGSFGRPGSLHNPTCPSWPDHCTPRFYTYPMGALNLHTLS